MKNLSLKTKFVIFTSIFIAVFLILILIFTIDIVRYNNYKNYSDEVVDIQKNYLELRQSHQYFFTNYKEDNSFFKTGKNKHLRQSELQSKDIVELIQNTSNKRISKKMNTDIMLLDISENLENIDILIKTIGQKIYRRGSGNTGIIGEMQRSYEYIIQHTSSQTLLTHVYKLKLNEDNYIFSGDKTYYNDYLSSFLKLNAFLSDKKSIIDTTLNNTDSLNFIHHKDKAQISKTVVENFNKYKKEFTALVNIDKELGYSLDAGLYNEMQVEVDKIYPAFDEVNEILNTKINRIYKNNITNLAITLFLCVIFLVITIMRFSFLFIKPIDNIREYIFPLRKGILPRKQIEINSKDEMAEISLSLNNLITGLKATTNFASKIGGGHFNTEYTPLSNEDVLGNSLLQMRKNLQQAKIRDEKREKEDSIRKWVNDGVSEFAGILRQATKDIGELSSNVIKNLVSYLMANQGGVFLYNDEKIDDIHLELVASYAFNKERKKKKKIFLGEGLIGTCAVEKASIYMTEIPNDYITITSGLGGANPRSLFIVPLRLEDQILGVIEIASFNVFEAHEREFIEKVTESIAATLSITKINQRTNRLLSQAQKQTEIMQAQEEEMRQNFEELKTTQEESNRRELEMKGTLYALNNTAPVIEYDLRGNIMIANTNILKILDISENKFIGHNILEFAQDQESLFVNDEFINVIQKGETYKNKSTLIIDNQKFYFEEYYTAIFDRYSEVEKILCISFNITEPEKYKLNLEDKKEILSKEQTKTNEEKLKLKEQINSFTLINIELKTENKKLKEREINLKKKLKKNIKLERELNEKVNLLNSELTELKNKSNKSKK